MGKETLMCIVKEKTDEKIHRLQEKPSPFYDVCCMCKGVSGTP